MKKVLLISQNSVSNHANNGKTFTNIFDQWESKNFAQIYFQDEIPESKKFNNFYRLRDIDILKKILSFNIDAGDKINAQEYVFSHHEDKNNSQLRFRNFLKKFAFLKKIIREILYNLSFMYSKKLLNWVDEFSPDAIFVAVSEQTFVFKFGLNLAKKYKLPIYFFFLDDFYFNKKDSHILSLINYRYLSYTRAAIFNSKRCFCIGDLMAKTYSAEFGYKFDVLINPVSDSFFKFKVKHIEKKKKYKILYAGGTTIGRFDVLIQLSEIFKKILHDHNLYIELIICTGTDLTDKQLSLLESNSITFLGKLDASKLDQAYCEVDFALHIESNKQKFIKKTKLSVSTKIPECLSKGICLIGYGPSNIASMALLKDNNIGYYVNSEVVDDAIANFVYLFSNPSIVNEIVKNGIDYSYSNFSKKNISSKLSSIINID